MNELKSIDREYQRIKTELKEKKNDLNAYYKIVQDISDLIKRINKRSELVIIQKRNELINIYLKDKNNVKK